ncbi:MAG: hypothetical protein M1815_001839 [Lichina confinis]|nr:MAG: hypothetical protein M1815_001839 [Lichina confinis]
MAFSGFIYSQLFVTPPYPTHDFSGQTIIVTGSNTGLGLEAARHLVRLNAEKVILAVRSTDKGEAARRSIEESTKRPGVVEVWSLDLSSYQSVRQFADRAKGLNRLDVLLENAGIATDTFALAEDDEATITVNVVSTFLLGLLLLPKLRETGQRFNILPRLVIVSSEVHFLTSFPERKSANIFETLNKKEQARMLDRYNVSKLLEVFVVRELSGQLESSTKGKVVINALNPGLCYSELTRDATGVKGLAVKIFKALLARTTEVGSRTLVHAAGSGQESQGEYLSDSTVKRPAPLVLGSEGAETQKRVWDELSKKLEVIHPGILENL